MNGADQPYEGAVLMAKIRRWWKGDERLVVVYWVGLAILLGVYILGRAAEYVPGDDSAALLVYVVALCCAAFWFVSVWNCAFNVKHSVWGYLARIHVGVGAVSAVGRLLG